MESKQIDFGDRVAIEMFRFGVPNEHYTHKVVNRLHSNAWVDVPIQSPATEINHIDVEPVLSVICEGIVETKVYKVLERDVKLVDPTSEGKEDDAIL